MKRLTDFYEDHRDGIGITGIASGIIGVLTLIIWLTAISNGWALVWIVLAVVAGLVITGIVFTARAIWEEFFE